MSDSPNSTEGAYIPFPIPIGALEADPFASSDASLCWSGAWTGVIIGALKVLTRPETWSGNDTQIARACLMAESLIAGITDGCSSGGETFPFSCEADFTASPSPFGDFVVYTDTGMTPPECGEWFGGVGWDSTRPQNTVNLSEYREIVGIRCTLDSPIATGLITIHYNLIKGTFIYGGWQNGIAAFHGGTLVNYTVVNSQTDEDGDNKTMSVDCGGAMVDNFFFTVTAAYNHVSDPTGSAQIKRVIWQGNGTPSPCA